MLSFVALQVVTFVKLNFYPPFFVSVEGCAFCRLTNIFMSYLNHLGFMFSTKAYVHSTEELALIIRVKHS